LAAMLILGVFCLNGPASAAVYNFTFSDASGDTASGQFTTTGSGPTLTIASIMGTFDGETITGLSTYASADQSFSPKGGFYFDQSGLSFDLSGGKYTEVNIWSGFAFFNGRFSDS